MEGLRLVPCHFPNLHRTAHMGLIDNGVCVYENEPSAVRPWHKRNTKGAKCMRGNSTSSPRLRGLNGKLPYLFYGERGGISPHHIFSTHARTQKPSGFTQPRALRSLLRGMVLSSYTALWINLQLCDPESPRRCAGVRNTIWPLSFVSWWPSLAWRSLSSAWPAKDTTLQSTVEKYVIFFCLGQKVVLMWAQALKLPASFYFLCLNVLVLYPSGIYFLCQSVSRARFLQAQRDAVFSQCPAKVL